MIQTYFPSPETIIQIGLQSTENPNSGAQLFGYTLFGIDEKSMPVFLYTKRTAAALVLYNQFTTKIM